MRIKLSFSVLLIFTIGQLFSQEQLLINAYNRTSQSLNGTWNYIVDPYENGYYNYRRDAFDQSENPDVSAYFLNSKPKNNA